MIVSMLADKVSLSPKVVKSLIRSLAEVARADARDSTDLQWCRMSLMTLVTLVQVLLCSIHVGREYFQHFFPLVWVRIM